jgi:hypothetical protein
VIHLERQLNTIMRSRSWRLTAPLRGARQLTAALRRGQTYQLRVALKRAYANLPLSVETRLRIKNVLFRAFPFAFRRTNAYAAWVSYRQSEQQRLQPAPIPAGSAATPLGVQPQPAGPVQQPLPTWFYEDEDSGFVPLTTTPGVAPRIKAIAFYLPQFHQFLRRSLVGSGIH